MRLFVLGLMLIGVVLFLGAAGAVLNNHSTNRAEHAELKEHGQLADAFVLSRERSTGRRLSSSGRRILSPQYFVNYRYDGKTGSRGTISFNAALNGDEQTLDLTSEFLDFRLPATKAQYDAAGEGTRQAVIFLPEDPEVVRLVRKDGSYNRGSGIIWALLLAGLSGLSALLFWQYKTTGKTW